MQRGEDRLMQAAVFGMDTSNIDNLDASVICAPVRGLTAGDGTLAPGTKLADQEMTVDIGGAPDKITKRFCFANDMADVFGIDTSVIAGFDKNALIEKVVQGPPDIEGKWNLCTVMMAFVPAQWKARRHAVEALSKTSIADYPSRKELQITRNNVS